MNKKLILLGILLTMSLLLVNSASALSAANTNPNAGNPGDTVTGSFVLTDNVAGNAVTGVSFSVANLVGVTDSAQNILASAVTFNPTSIATMNVDGNANVATSVVIPANKAAQTYQGTVTVSGTENGNAVQTTFTLSVVVNSLTAVSVQTFDNSTPLEIFGEEGQTGKTGTFTIQNTGNQALNALTFDTSALDLSDSSNNAITLSFSTPGTLNSGQSATVTITANFGSSIDLDTYGGVVNVKQGSTTLDSFKLDLKIIPEICEDGIVNEGVVTSNSNGDIQIDIRDPDSGDNFKSGDTMNVEVRVDNDGSDNMDIAVTAILYDLDADDEIASFETSSEEINDGNDETFEFDLEIPRSSDLDESNRYVLYVKAFEDGNEDENCNFESLTLDFERERDDVVFDQVDVTPSVVRPGDNVNMRLDLKNEGTRDQDNVYVKVVNSELGINLISNEFDLQRAGDSDDDIVRTFTATIPTSAVAKDYLIEFTIYDESDDAFENGQEFVTLKVQGEGTSGTGSGNVVNVNVKSNTPTVNAVNGRASLNFVFTNNEKANLDAVVEVVTVGSWAKPIAPQTLNLRTGDNSLYFDVELSDGVEQGPKSATVIIRPSGNSDFDSQSYSFNFDVQGTESGSLFNGSIPTLFWVIGDVVLVLLAIFIVKALFFGKKH